MGFKEEIGSEEEPTPGDGVVDIEDDEITREGDEVWRSFLVSFECLLPPNATPKSCQDLL